MLNALFEYLTSFYCLLKVIRNGIKWFHRRMQMLNTYSIVLNPALNSTSLLQFAILLFQMTDKTRK